MNKNEQPSMHLADDKIVDMYWERNPDAIQETDQKYGPLLRNVACNILADALDCEECQNDAYLGIWNAIPTARPRTFVAFIVQIMRRTAIDRYRENTRIKRIPSQLTTSIQELENAISHGPSIEEIYDAKEIGEMVSAYLESLNSRQRYIFIDRYYAAETVEKIAADLSIPVQTVYWELRRIKRGLKGFLERNGVRV